MARALWLTGVAAVIAGPVLARELPPAGLFGASLVWLAAAVLVIGGSAVTLWRRMGPAGPIGLVAVLLAAGLVLGREWPPHLAARLPCHRNLGWLPSYLLRPSPLESVSGTIGNTRVKICYGSPRVRGRKMIGGAAVPFGHLWRVGANEPTTVIATGPILIGGIAVPTGRASLYAVPGPETWEIVVNGSTRQWGIESEYERARTTELGRTIVPPGPASPFAEALVIEVERGLAPGTGTMIIRWETTVLRIPVAEETDRTTVK